MKLITTFIVGIIILSCNSNQKQKENEFQKELNQLQNEQVEKLTSLVEYGYDITKPNDTINLTSDLYSGNSQTTVHKIKTQMVADQELLLTILKIQKLRTIKPTTEEIQNLEEKANRIKKRRLSSTEAHFLDGEYSAMIRTQ